MNKLSAGQMIAIGAALLVLLCFFFPWVELNLLLASTNLSGFQLATGSGPGGSSAPTVSSLFLVPLSMIGVLVIAAMRFASQGSATQLKSIAGLLLIAAGGIRTLVILYQYFNLNQQFNQNVLGMIACPAPILPFRTPLWIVRSSAFRRRAPGLNPPPEGGTPNQSARKCSATPSARMARWLGVWLWSEEGYLI